MKRSIVLGALLLSCFSQANARDNDTGHSMSPWDERQYVYQESIVKKYTIHNDSQRPQSYSMYLEDAHTGEVTLVKDKVLVPAYSTRDVMVPFTNIPHGKLVSKYVCSESIPDEKSMIRSKICARFQYYLD